jgi:hypothetical protein
LKLGLAFLISKEYIFFAMKNRQYNDIENKITFDDGKVITEQTQDCDHIVKSVKALKDEDGGKKGFGYHAARIPMVLLLKWAQEDCGDQLAYLQGKHNKEPWLARKLAARMNSSEFRDFRVWEGNVSASDMLKEGNKT